MIQIHEVIVVRLLAFLEDADTATSRLLVEDIRQHARKVEDKPPEDEQ